MNSSDTVAERNALALAGLRIAVGCLFLIFGEYKVFGTQFTLHGGFQFWINRFLQEGAAYSFMVPVLKSFVLPHATAIAFLVAYGELAIGLALVLGICVRLASAFGCVYMLTLLFSSNYPGANAPMWQYFGASLDHLVLALCFAAFVAGRSHAKWSLARWRRI
jgi:thiosulfate dehydrogenase [quinone] large subunit